MTYIELIRTKKQYEGMIDAIVESFRNDGGSLELNVETSPLRHECNHLWILALSPNSDAINQTGQDLVQVQSINGIDGLLASMAFYAVLADCNKKLQD